MGRKGRKEKGKKGRKSRGGRKERRQARNLDTDSIFMGFTFPSSSVKRHINRKLQYTISVDQLCPWTAARQDSLSIINSQSSLKLMSIELVMPSSPLSSPSLLAFNLSQHQGLFQGISSSHQVAKVLEFSVSISPSNEYSRLIFFRIDWLNLLEVQRTLKSLLQNHNSKASILLCSAFFIVQLFLNYESTRK